jgi:hypothetical protein
MFYANPSLKKAQLRVPQLLQLGRVGGGGRWNLQKDFVRDVENFTEPDSH